MSSSINYLPIDNAIFLATSAVTDAATSSAITDATITASVTTSSGASLVSGSLTHSSGGIYKGTVDLSQASGGLTLNQHYYLKITASNYALEWKKLLRAENRPLSGSGDVLADLTTAIPGTPTVESGSYTFTNNGSPVTVTYRFYAPTRRSLDLPPLVISYHGTANDAGDEMGPNTAYPAQVPPGQDWGGPFWPELAERYKCAVLCINCLTPDAGGGIGNYQRDIRAAIALARSLQQRNVVGTTTYVTGHSSGASLAFIHAMFFPTGWSGGALTISKCCLRHSSAGGYRTVADTTAGLNNYNDIIQHNWTTAGADLGVTGISYDWKTSTAAKAIPILIINSDGDGDYFFQSYVTIDAMAAQGYTANNIAGLMQKVYPWPGGVDVQNTGTQRFDYPHYLHAEDRDLAAKYFMTADGAASFLHGDELGSPRELTGLVGWWDATVMQGLYDTAAHLTSDTQSTVTTDTNPVGAIRDLSGNNNNMLQTQVSAPGA